MAKQANTLSLGSDNIGSLLWRYAAPAIIAMASNSIYHIIDSIFVGHGVGGAAIAGMAITMPIMNIAGAFGAMVGVGAAARMSIRLGEGNMQAAEKTLANAVMLNLILGFVLMAFMLIFLDPILQLFSGGNASAETIGYARDFMRIILLGNMTQHMYLGLNEQIRASGYPQKSMRIILTAVALNLCLNPLFIFKFGWGIKGSALATVISQAVSFLIASSHFCQKSSFVRFRRAAFVLDWKIIKAIISIGLAPFMVNICASLVAAFVNTALLKYGGTGDPGTLYHKAGNKDRFTTFRENPEFFYANPGGVRINPKFNFSLCLTNKEVWKDAAERYIRFENWRRNYYSRHSKYYTPQGSQSSSRVGAFTCAFLPSCSSSVTLPFAWIKGSVAFPRGFPTRLSHRAVQRATVV